jgi:hypothetical protein
MSQRRTHIAENIPNWLKRVNDHQNEKHYSCREMCVTYFPQISFKRYLQYLYYPKQLPATTMLTGLLQSCPQFKDTIVAGIRAGKIPCPEIYKGVIIYFPELSEELITWIKDRGVPSNGQN